MRRFNRWLILTFVSSVIAVIATIFNPVSFLHRLLSFSTCIVFSATSTLCPAYLSTSSQKVIAANPPAIEQTIIDEPDGINQSEIISDLAQVSSDGSPVYIFYVNGIRTPGVKYENDLNLIRNFFRESGIQVAGVDGEHNPTGITLGIGDVFESIIQNFIAHGSTNKELVNRVVDKIKAIDNNLRRTNLSSKMAKFLLIGHSQGNFFIEEIADKIQSLNLPNNLANRISILGISPFTSYRKSRMRKHYLLREDDLPKAHTLARVSPKGTPKPNLPPLAVATSIQSGTQNISHSMNMDICGRMEMSQNLRQTAVQGSSGSLFQGISQSLSPSLVMERPPIPDTIINIGQNGSVQVTTVPGTSTCNKPSPLQFMIASFDEQSKTQESPNGIQSQTSSRASSITRRTGTMQMSQNLNLSGEQVTLEPAIGLTIHRESHRLDYYLGSLTNHFAGFKEKYIYSINLARNKAIGFIRELLNYNPGTYRNPVV